VAKHKHLLGIEERLEDSAEYPGPGAFYNVSR
jgi:hypothetical protein